MPKRFGKYGLTIHPDKTRLVPFMRPGRVPSSSGSGSGASPGPFDFLGFTHYWSRAKSGSWVVKRKTAGSRFRRALERIGAWCRLNRHLPLREQYATLCGKLQGHYAYYGAVMGNLRCQQRFRYQVMRLWHYWLSRRKRRGRIPWDAFNRLLQVLRLPWPSGWVAPCAASP